MKCSNCGNSLTLLEKYCPNCGSLNVQSKKHIDDMEKYEKSFNETKLKVEKNSRWFTGIIAPIAVFIISALFMIICMAANYMDFSYELSRIIQGVDNSAHQESMEEYILTLIDEGKYNEVLQLQERKNISLSYKKYERRSELYDAMEGYCALRKNIQIHKNIYYSDSYYIQNKYNNMADAISKINSSVSYRYRGGDEVCMKYIEDIQTKRDMLLKACCNFTDEDISMVGKMSKNEILILLTRRMGDEN